MCGWNAFWSMHICACVPCHTFTVGFEHLQWPLSQITDALCEQLLNSFPSWGHTSDVCFAQRTQVWREPAERCYSCLSWVAGHSGMSPELMTFANSVPDCQLHRGKEMTRLVRTTVSWGSGVPSTALYVWHPAVNMQPAMALRHSNLKVLFGPKKDSSAHVMASTRHVSSSLTGDNLGQMLSFTQRTPSSREGARNTPGEVGAVGAQQILGDLSSGWIT